MGQGGFLGSFQQRFPVTSPLYRTIKLTGLTTRAAIQMNSDYFHGPTPVDSPLVRKKQMNIMPTDGLVKFFFGQFSSVHLFFEHPHCQDETENRRHDQQDQINQVDLPVQEG